MDVERSAMTGENITKAPSLTRHQHLAELPQKIRQLKPRGPFRRYIAHQVEKVFELVVEEGKTAKETVLLTAMSVRTYQHCIKKYNDDEERRLSVGVSPCTLRCQTNPSQAVPGLWISISALHRYLAQKCKLTLKKLEKLFATRKRDRALILQREKVEEREAMDLDLDFAKNCMFIDEVGFILHTQRSYGRSRKGTPAKRIVWTAKDITSTGS